MHGTAHGGTQGQDGGPACQGTGGGHHPRLREAGVVATGAVLAGGIAVVACEERRTCSAQAG